MGNIADILVCNACQRKNQEKIVLITGCDSDFGKLLVEQSKTIGFTVIAVVYTAEGLETMHKTLGREAGVAVKAELTEENDMHSIIDVVNVMVAQTGMQLWAIINNAYVNENIQCQSADTYEKSLKIKFLAPTLLIYEVLPFLEESKGRVINISYSEFGAISDDTTHNSSALEAFSETLRREMKPFGVNVVMIQPNTAQTSSNDLRKDLNGNLKTKSPALEEVWNENSDAEKSKDLKFEQNFAAGKKETVKVIEMALTSNDPAICYWTGKMTRDFFSPISTCHFSSPISTIPETGQDGKSNLMPRTVQKKQA